MAASTFKDLNKQSVPVTDSYLSRNLVIQNEKYQVNGCDGVKLPQYLVLELTVEMGRRA